MLWWLMVAYLAVNLAIMMCLLIMVVQHLLKLRRANRRQEVAVADEGIEPIAMIEQ